MTKIKTVRKKGKLKPKEKGEPLSYKKLDKTNAKDIKSIRGIFRAWHKSKKFVLKLESTHEIRMYLSVDHTLTAERKKAKMFAHGFDNTEVKVDYWNKRLGVKFNSENI